MHYRGPLRATIDGSTVCIFGKSETNRNKCKLITFNTKREETVVAEVAFRMGCAMGCVNGKCESFIDIMCITFNWH